MLYNYDFLDSLYLWIRRTYVEPYQSCKLQDCWHTALYVGSIPWSTTFYVFNSTKKRRWARCHDFCNTFEFPIELIIVLTSIHNTSTFTNITICTCHHHEFSSFNCAPMVKISLPFIAMLHTFISTGTLEIVQRWCSNSAHGKVVFWAGRWCVLEVGGQQDKARDPARWVRSLEFFSHLFIFPSFESIVFSFLCLFSFTLSFSMWSFWQSIFLFCLVRTIQ